MMKTHSLDLLILILALFGVAAVTFLEFGFSLPESENSGKISTILCVYIFPLAHVGSKFISSDF